MKNGAYTLRFQIQNPRSMAHAGYTTSHSHPLNALVTQWCLRRGIGLNDYANHVVVVAVRLVAGSSRRDHAFSLLGDRHLLPVKQRVEYKLCMMVHRCLYGDAPSYLLNLITSSADATVRGGLRSAASSRPAQSQCHEQCHRSATGHSLRLAPAHGTDYHHRFVAFILLLF